MNRFASLFPSPENAEQAVSALSSSRIADYIDARIVGESDWKANWGIDEKRAKARRHSPDFYLDLWLNDDAIRFYTEGLKKGGAILVVSVPEELSRQVEKVVKENNGKWM